MNNDMGIHDDLLQEGFTSEQLALLDAALDAQLIKQRPDGKKYLKGATEFDAANRIFGYGRWGYKVISRTLQKAYDLDDRVVGMYFYVEVELYVTGAMFPFYGDGEQVVAAYNAQGYANASKGATTDAVKRALRHYGDQFGLCLYDEDALVDVGDGDLAPVKSVRPGQLQKQKQIVEAGNGVKPAQLPQPKPQVSPELKERLNITYKRAVDTAQFTRTRNESENLAAFFEWAGKIIGIKITGPGDLNIPRLDLLDSHMKSQDAA